MNALDSQKVAALCAARATASAEPDDADLLIVNTCSIRDKAEQRSYTGPRPAARVEGASARVA
jgi:tRNA A37 methylthiotransferase MiaB